MAPHYHRGDSHHHPRSMDLEFTVEERAYLLMHVGANIRMHRITDMQRRQDDKPELYKNRLEFLQGLLVKLTMLPVKEEEHAAR